MISLMRIKYPVSMICYFRLRFEFYSATSSVSRGCWDPTVSLTLKHPTLVLLEKYRTSDQFKQILCQMMRLHLITQTFPMSRLLYFSAVSHPENLKEAILLFNHFTPSPNLFICNIMVSALSFSARQSIDLYKFMLSACIYPDEQTLLALLKSCKNLSVGKNIHAHAVIIGFSSHTYLQNSLIKMYLENGRMGLAQQVFQQMHTKDTVSYNIMISGYSKMGCTLEAFELLNDMRISGMEPDQYTMVGILTCCGHLKDVLIGKSVHGWIVRKASLSNWGLVLSNALLDMYVKCEDMKRGLKVFNRLYERDGISWNIIISGFASIGELDLACKFFNEAPVRDLVSWNSLLAGCARKGDIRRVVKLFRTMIDQNVRPDNVTAINLVCAAAEMGVLNQGRCIHGWAYKEYGNMDAFLGSALIDMYSKCGSIERSLAVFETLSNKDIAVWTAMISGLAFHGYGFKALELFKNMQEEGLVPNSVTLLAVLTACSHSGFVDQGYNIFKYMKVRYGVEPGVEHYGCLIDLFARSGRLTDATDLIRRMPMKPSSSIWGSVLSASKVHRDSRLAEAALRELQMLEPEKEGGFVLMSNVYASCGQWNYCDEVRENIGSRGIKKMAGCSSLVVSGVVHEFISSDKRHPRREDIYLLLYNLHREMRSGTEVT